MKSIKSLLSLLALLCIFSSPHKTYAQNQHILYEMTYQDSWYYDKNNWFYLDNQSRPLKNQWLYWNEEWYYLNEQGIMLEDKWLAYGNYWYYFDDNGKMVTRPYLVDGKLEGFDSYGHWTKNNYSYLGVDIQIKGNGYDNIISNYIHQLEILPDELTTLPEKYIFSDEFETGIHPHTVGYISSTFKDSLTSKTTIIDSITISSLEFHNSTLLHELTHALDVLTRYKLSDNPLFLEAINQEKHIIQDIAYSHDPVEYLAYLSVDYFKDPLVAKSRYPKCADYIEDIFKEYEISSDYYMINN